MQIVHDVCDGCWRNDGLKLQLGGNEVQNHALYVMSRIERPVWLHIAAFGVIDDDAPWFWASVRGCGGVCRSRVAGQPASEFNGSPI